MEKARYNRQIILSEVGLQGQEKLQQAKVLIIGVGGLGSAVLPYLVASGIGEIGIVDADTIDVSNLHRQVIFATNSVGESKVVHAKKMALELNPFIKINAISENLNPKNAIDLFEQYDIIVDATDDLQAKYLINDASCVTGKPFVYGSVYKFEGQVSVFNYQNGPSFRCLFPDQTNAVSNCNDNGVLGTSVGIIGMFQANEVLKMILEIGEVLSGKLLVYTMLNNEQQKFEFQKTNNSTMNLSFFQSQYPIENELEIETSLALKQINNPNVVFLDVRNFDEYPKLSIQNCVQIPLTILETTLHQLDSTKEIFVFCQSGVRSKIAVDVLKKNKFDKVQSIIGGAIKLDAVLSKKIHSLSIT